MAGIDKEMKDLAKRLDAPDRPPASAVLPRIKAGLAAGGRARKPAAQALAAVAGDLVGPEIEDIVDELLTDDKEAYQKLGLEIVARLRKPPASLTESVADCSYLPEARRALLRFDRERVKKELKSLLGSKAPNERLTGLQIVSQYGPSAAEFTPQIAESLKTDQNPKSAIAAINALARLMPEEALTVALEPTLDHVDAGVRAASKRHLARIGAPIRDSAWKGHPFSSSLHHRLQSMGFKPKGSMVPPSERLVDMSRSLEWAPGGFALEPFELSPTIWAFLNMVEYPPHTLYTVWGSYDDAQTFHFSEEAPIYVVPKRGGKGHHLMQVIGDGSIGYFACIDLTDTGNDPSVYYVERWHAEGWRASYSLSSYLRSLGLRS